MSTQTGLDEDWGTTSVPATEPADVIDVEAQRREVLDGGARYGRSNNGGVVDRAPAPYVCDGCGRTLEADDERKTARVMGDRNNRVETCGKCDDEHSSTSAALSSRLGGDL